MDLLSAANSRFRNSIRLRIQSGMFALAFMTFFGQYSNAQTTLNWIGSGGLNSSYHVPGNWLQNRVPGTQDIARFDIPFAVPLTIGFTENSVVNELQIPDNDLTFRSTDLNDLPTTFNANQMTIDGDGQLTLVNGTNDASFELLADTVNVFGKFRITEGTKAVGGEWLVNVFNSDDPAFLCVSGGHDSTPSQLQLEDLNIGLDGAGKVRIEDGAVINVATRTTLSTFTDGAGELEIDGSNNPLHPSRMSTEVLFASPGSNVTLNDLAELVVGFYLTQGEFDSPGRVTATSPQARIQIATELLTNGGTTSIEQGALLETNLASIARFGDVPFGIESIQLKIQSSDLNNPSTWINSGDVFVGGNRDSGSPFGGDIKIDGGRVEIGGTLTIWNGGRFTISETNGVPNLVVVDTINNSFGGSFDFEAGALSADLIIGELEQFGGTLAPGDDTIGDLPGQTTIAGDYFQFPGATLSMDIGGQAPIFEHDFLDVGGFMLLNGRLEISLRDNFVPSPMDEIRLASAANILGSFENVASGERIATEDGSGSFEVQYGFNSSFGPGEIVLVNYETGDIILGDINGDGMVDLLDIAPFVDAITSGIFQAAADANQDGTLNLLDVQPFVLLLTQ